MPPDRQQKYVDTKDYNSNLIIVNDFMFSNYFIIVIEFMVFND